MISSEICNCNEELSLVFRIWSELSKTAQEGRQELKTKPINFSRTINGKASKASFRGAEKLRQHFPLGYQKSDKTVQCTAESWSTLAGPAGMFPVPMFTDKALGLGDTNLTYLILLTQLLLLLK